MLIRNYLAEEFIHRLGFDFGNFRECALNCAVNFQRLSECHSDEARKAEIETQSFWLLGAFLKRAKEICAEQSLEASSTKAVDVFDKAFAEADYLRYLMCDASRHTETSELTSVEVNRLYALRISLDKHSPISQQLKTRDIPGRVSGDLELFVKEYLSSPFRSKEVDAEILKILAEEEPLQYIHHVAWENPSYPLLGMKAKLTAAEEFANQINRPVVGFLLKMFLEASIVSGLLITGAIYLNWDVILYVALILSVSWILYSTYNAAQYLRYRSDYRGGKITNKHTEVFKMTLAMEDFMRTLRSDGSISISRIEHKLADLEKIGAVMPETLFVFIDDLKAKGVTAI